MELRQIKYFVTLAEELHFRRAAERLNMTQPPLSQAIKELESELGATLLERGRKRYVRLTVAGRAFLESARMILHETERARQSTRIAQKGESGRLTIAHTDDYIADFLPDLLYRFNLRHPNVYLDFAQEFSTRFEEFNRGELDCVFTTLPLSAAIADCAILPLPPTPIVAVIPEDHALSKRSRVKLRQIGHLFERECHFHLTGTRTVAFEMKLAQLLNKAGVQIRATLAPSSSFVEMEMVRRGYGVTFATAGSIPANIKGLATVKLDEPDAYLERALIWREDNANPTLSRFLEMVRELF